VTAPVGFDLETATADKLFSYGPGFIKVAGFTSDDVARPVWTTHYAEELIAVLRQAPWIYGHNIFGFDLLALAYHHGADWDELSRKAVDTEILDRLVHPPMARDTGGSLDKYDLDHVSERYGVPGKTGSLADIARVHGGYDNIPSDDPGYLDYLKGDVDAVKALIARIPNGPILKGEGAEYARREHRIAGINGQITLNGFRVDIPLLEERISLGEEYKRAALESLRDDYDLPLGRFGWKGRGDKKEEFWEDFGSPLATLEGRKWLIEVWDAFGVRNPPVTDTGRLSVSAADLRPIAESSIIHPDLRRILGLMITVTTTRTIYQTVRDHLAGDRVHPLIVMRQASGRSSVTSPGLTVMGKHGGRHIERDVLVPDEGRVLISGDLNQVDMRAVAALSGDKEYARLFEPGKDVHREHAIMIYGDETFRQEAKAIGHGANYGQGPSALIAKGHNPERVRQFFEYRSSRFPRLMEWTEEIREQAKSGGLLDNGFGRLMRPDPKRAHTQGPALMGQGGAADLLKEVLLRLPPEFRPWLKLTVHDEILLDVPEGDAREVREELRKAMTFEWKGVPILCDVSEPGYSWGEVSAK